MPLALDFVEKTFLSDLQQGHTMNTGCNAPPPPHTHTHICSNLKYLLSKTFEKKQSFSFYRSFFSYGIILAFLCLLVCLSVSSPFSYFSLTISQTLAFLSISVHLCPIINTKTSLPLFPATPPPPPSPSPQHYIIHIFLSPGHTPNWAVFQIRSFSLFGPGTQ